MSDQKKFGTESVVAEQQHSKFPELKNDAAAAAIKFALSNDEGMQFLRLWQAADFDAIRSDWPDAPEEVFIGADPLHNASSGTGG